jgi:ATP-dependent exoDNAse (exonuclease V) beta subunit
MAERRFLGGKELFATAVANKLSELKSEKVPDFSRTVIVLPGKIARQNLRKELLKIFPEGLFLPRLTTPHGLLHFENDAAQEKISADAEVILWGKAVNRALAEKEHFPLLFREGALPNNPFEAGKCFAGLRNELIAGNVSIAEAADKLGARGSELARLEEYFLKELNACALADKLDLDRKAAEDTAAFAGVEKLILAGLPDLPEIILRKAQNIDRKFPEKVEVWINDPVTDSDKFDLWGTPVPEIWQNRSYLCRNIHTALNPVDGARKAALLAAKDNGVFSPDECAVVLADPALFKDFAKEFSKLKDDSGANLAVADPAGVPLKALRISHLLNKAAAFFSAPDDYRAADELLRERDFLRYAAGVQGELGKYLNLLDNFKQRYYPDRFSCARELAEGEIKQLFAKLSYWEKIFNGSKTVVFLRKFLTEVYKETDGKAVFNGIPFSAECDLVNARLNELEKLPDTLADSISKNDLLTIFLENSGEERVTLPVPDGALVFEGRLEMPFLLQKKIIFCGMNEGYFPDRIKPTPFLTDSIRQSLGIRSNKETLIRSVCHLFSTMTGRKEDDLQLIVLRQDSENSILKPSGILFNGKDLSDNELISRCQQLFCDPIAIELKKEETAAKKFMLAPKLDFRRTNDGKMLLRVTDIDQYLRSPFDFFCSRVLGYEETDYEICEPDVRTSGTLIHAAFEELGCETFPSAEKLKDKLIANFKMVMLRNYGTELPVLLKLFSSGIIQRLGYAAEKVFAEQLKGYEVLATEYSFGGREENSISAYGAVFRGKIDRIEYNRSTQTLRITDIKTGKVDNVIKDHCTVTKNNVIKFTKLQLPLYALLIKKDEYFRKNIFPEIDNCKIECAYITVPNIVTDCDVKVWQSDDLNLILPDAELKLKKIIEEISLLPENKLFTEPKKIVSPWLKPNAASALEGVEIIVPVKESKEAEEEKKNSKAPAKSKSRRCSAPTRPFETVQETSDDIGCTRCCDCPEKEKKMCRCYHGECASCKSFNGFKSFNLITASAGTGKTYSLASRFIQLMEYGVPPESIMAVTFTKKAAGEIFDRIITRICDMALHPEKSENACTRFPAEKLPDLIRRLTASNSGDLQISTIDSFFMRLMQSFAPDFGIWGNISLLDESDDRYRRKILNRWLAELRSEEEQDALRELIKEADASNKGGIYESLIKLVNSISSYWKQNIQSTSDGLPPQIRYSPYRINADDVMKVDECDECIGRLRGFAKEYSDLHEVLGKRGMDTLARRLEKLADALEKNFAGAFFHRLDSDVTKLLETLNNKNPDKIWCDDDDDAPLAYSIELSEGLPALIRKAVRHIRALAAYQARRKTLAVAELIGKFEKIYSDAVRSSGKLTFADLPAIMINSDSSETLLGPEDHSLEMRLDARFDHYMLDEFQDTANVQMMVMGQLFNEIFSTGNEGERFRSFFCVGDMKQSIYQWRGGNPELFNFVAAKLKVLSKAAGYDALDSLSLSYRSSQTVLDAVNAVFSTPYSGSVKGVAEVLERMEYHTHRSAKKDLAGHTAVFEVPQLADDPDNISAKMKIILKVLDEVKPFEHGISVGILVQENKFGKKCAEKLRELTDLPISVDGKISAVDTMVFNVYRSLLTMALHPEDKSSSLFLSMLTFGEKVTDSYLMKKLDWNENLSLAEAAAEELFSNQLSGFTAKFCRAFYAECGNSDKSALDILDKAAENFSGSPEEFLTRIADYSENKHSTANTIQIMTYHKSKGLEFDMVFLPQTGNPRGNHPKLTPESKLVRYSKDDYGTELLQPEWTAYTPVEAVSWLIPPFNENISEQKTVKNFEKCCNLYVAMTRAKRALYMLLSCSETSSALAPDKLLQERLTPYGIAANDLEWHNEFNEPFENDPVRITFSRGSRQWYTNTHISAKALPEAVTMPKARVPETSTVSHASDGKDELFALPPERRFSEYSAKNTGTEVHKLFSKIEFIDDEFAEKEFASGASVEAQKIFISALAEDSPLRDALKKSSEDMEVWREKNFVLRDSEGNITAGTFDRVEIFRENGNIVSAVVIDYKSDSFNSVKDALIYADQLKKYRCSLAQLLDIAEDKISCKIYALKLKKIADIH